MDEYEQIVPAFGKLSEKNSKAANKLRLSKQILVGSEKQSVLINIEKVYIFNRLIKRLFFSFFFRVKKRIKIILIAQKSG